MFEVIRKNLEFFVNKFSFLIKKIKPKKNVNTKKDLLNFNFNKMVEKLLVKIN